jgi:hypothetical protein
VLLLVLLCPMFAAHFCVIAACIPLTRLGRKLYKTPKGVFNPVGVDMRLRLAVPFYLIPEITLIWAFLFYFDTTVKGRPEFSLFLENIASHKFSFLGESFALANLPWGILSLVSYALGMCLLMSVLHSMRTFPDEGFVLADGSKVTSSPIRTSVTIAFFLHLCMIPVIPTVALYRLLTSARIG